MVCRTWGGYTLKIEGHVVRRSIGGYDEGSRPTTLQRLPTFQGVGPEEPTHDPIIRRPNQPHGEVMRLAPGGLPAGGHWIPQWGYPPLVFPPQQVNNEPKTLQPRRPAVLHIARIEHPPASAVRDQGVIRSGRVLQDPESASTHAPGSLDLGLRAEQEEECNEGELASTRLI